MPVGTIFSSGANHRALDSTVCSAKSPGILFNGNTQNDHALTPGHIGNAEQFPSRNVNSGGLPIDRQLVEILSIKWRHRSQRNGMALLGSKHFMHVLPTANNISMKQLKL
jgi:hypothetical protein